jgi:hypothetical protein
MSMKIYIYLSIFCLIFTIIMSILNMILPDKYIKTNFFKAAIILDISVILLIIVSLVGTLVGTL